VVSEGDREKADAIMARIAPRLTVVAHVPASVLRECVEIVAASLAAERERVPECLSCGRELSLVCFDCPLKPEPSPSFVFPKRLNRRARDTGDSR
jgi:hypothetical protein